MLTFIDGMVDEHWLRKRSQNNKFQGSSEGSTAVGLVTILANQTIILVDLEAIHHLVGDEDHSPAMPPSN